ncbi:hypothetical protein E3N88_15569 [Mikania micrantha]|uniref:Uncharacterized protein n=1 Tax=Mikania micrantha TaxID=192012 RepID=A0A5N6NVZ3_9ASTR|nr:hypothetical protein E3N88_15569 [Mikania micrantha]
MSLTLSTTEETSNHLRVPRVLFSDNRQRFILALSRRRRVRFRGYTRHFPLCFDLHIRSHRHLYTLNLSLKTKRGDAYGGTSVACGTVWEMPVVKATPKRFHIVVKAYYTSALKGVFIWLTCLRYSDGKKLLPLILLI